MTKRTPQAYNPPAAYCEVGVCMLGQIISRQKCPICGGALVHDEKRRGCYCKIHPQIAATRFIVRFPGDIYQRFADYTAATQRLNYLRHERGERRQHFNPDDYRTAKPNSYVVLVPKYLETKKTLRNYNRIVNIMNHAAAYFGLTNVREIGTGEIEDYLFSLTKDNGEPITEKTRFNKCSQLHDFWVWCRKRRAITMAEFPEFPEIKYELGYRKITDWKTQGDVIDKVRELAFDQFEDERVPR